MPPRKSKINKIVNEQAEQKIQSFVNKANDNNECDTSSEDDTNIYIKSIKNNINPPPPPPPHESPLDGTSHPPPIKKSKPKTLNRESKPKPNPEIVSPFMDERYLKLFSDYKNELAELKTIITGSNRVEQNPQPQVFQSLPQARREAMKLKFS